MLTELIAGRCHWLRLGTHSRSVGRAWVRHGVATVSVGNHLQDERSLAGLGPLLGKLDACVDSEDVHTVDLQAGDQVATGVVLRVARGSGSRGTHAVEVVLANEDRRLMVFVFFGLSYSFEWSNRDQ